MEEKNQDYKVDIDFFLKWVEIATWWVAIAKTWVAIAIPLSKLGLCPCKEACLDYLN